MARLSTTTGDGRMDISSSYSERSLANLCPGLHARLREPRQLPPRRDTRSDSDQMLNVPAVIVLPRPRFHPIANGPARKTDAARLTRLSVLSCETLRNSLLCCCGMRLWSACEKKL